MTIRNRSNRPAQNGAKLMDYLIAHLQLKNDAALGRLLGLAPPQICKMRHGHNPVTGDTLLLMHDITGLSIATLREQLRAEEAAPAEELAAA